MTSSLFLFGRWILYHKIPKFSFRGGAYEVQHGLVRSIIILTREEVVKDLEARIAHNGTAGEAQAFLDETYRAETIDLEYKHRKERYERGGYTEEQFYHGCLGTLDSCLKLLYE